MLPRMFNQLEEWIKGLCRYGKIEDYCTISREEKNGIGINLYTEKYRYYLSASFDDDIDDSNGYLGCIMNCRSSRPGETWTRGSDFPDGKFNKETWERIKSAIIGNELINVCDDVKKNKNRVIKQEEGSKV